jgi:hypothetical protein
VASYTLRVRNAGRTPARRVVLTVGLPAGFSRLSADGGLVLRGGVLRLAAGTLRAGAVAGARVQMRVDTTAVGLRTLRASVRATCGGRATSLRPLQIAAVAGVSAPAVTG